MVRKMNEDLSCSEYSEGLNRELNIMPLYIYLWCICILDTAFRLKILRKSQRIEKLERRTARFVSTEQSFPMVKM